MEDSRPKLDLVPGHESEPARVPDANLPPRLTPLIGREQALAATSEILRNPEVRFLTLTGSGGVGKTRLGVEVAREVIGEFADGVCFVSLAPIRNADLVVPTVAQTLGLKEAGDRPLLERLKAYLKHTRLLLFLDNFEHVAEAAPALAALLAACSELKVLATSRASLRLSVENEFPVPPLELPDAQGAPDPEELGGSESVALFVERARAVRPDFELTGENAREVAEICTRLDGLPLAIELAAARLKLLPTETLLERLEHTLPLLRGGWLDMPARQRTLRSTLRWSHDLLDEGEQCLFRRLSVFAGGFTLRAAEAVCDTVDCPLAGILEKLEGLIDKSMLRREEEVDTDQPRFTMLQTIQEYASERLKSSGEGEAIGRAHAGYYLTLAEEAEPELRGSRQVMWIERLDREQYNLRAAMRWLLGREELEETVKLGWALWLFWWIRGRFAEGRRLMEETLEKGETFPASLRAKASFVAGTTALGQSDFGLATALVEESLALFRELGDRRGCAYALGSLGIAAIREDQHQRAIACFEESQQHFIEIGESWGAALMLTFSATVWLGWGDAGRAKPLAERGLALLREIGDGEATSFTLYTLAVVAQAENDHEQARLLFEESLILSDEVRDDTNVAHCLEGLATIAMQKGAVTRAARLWGAAEALLEKIEPSVYPYTPDHHLYQNQVAARKRLGLEAFETSWAEGRTMTPGQAIQHALERPTVSKRATTTATPSTDPTRLTAREVEVLRLMAEGLTDSQVAERLHISPRTVGNHLRSVYDKLGVPSRAAAARRAVERGLL